MRLNPIFLLQPLETLSPIIADHVVFFHPLPVLLQKSLPYLKILLGEKVRFLVCRLPVFQRPSRFGLLHKSIDVIGVNRLLFWRPRLQDRLDFVAGKSFGLFDLPLEILTRRALDDFDLLFLTRFLCRLFQPIKPSRTVHLVHVDLQELFHPKFMDSGDRLLYDTFDGLGCLWVIDGRRIGLWAIYGVW